MAHVFISYSRKDTIFVEKLERDLHKNGIKIWRDAHNIPGGEKWYQSIVDGLEDSYAMVCVISPDADQSRWVLREQLYGDQRGFLRIPILPVPTTIPFHLIETQPILCNTENYEDGVKELIRVLNSISKETPHHTTTPSPSVYINRDIDAYLDFLLAEAKADLRDALYVKLMGISEQNQNSTTIISALSVGLDDNLGKFERLGLEEIKGDSFDRPGKNVDDIRIPLREVQRVVLLGEPGSGKTTTLLQFAVDLAREGKNTLDKLPIFVPLRQFDGSTSFEDFIRAQTHTLQSQFDKLVTNDTFIFLFDALNEMPRKGVDGRELIAEVQDYLKDKTTWVVSCRIRDYKEVLATLDGISKVRIKPLTPPSIYEIIQKQFSRFASQYPDRIKQSDGERLWQEMYGSDNLLKAWRVCIELGTPDVFWSNNLPEDISRFSDEYQAWIKLRKDKRRMLSLCRNPYLVNTVCRLYAISKTLPANRGALFAQFVDNLLEREHQNAENVGTAWLNENLIRNGLAYVAFEMRHTTQMSKTNAVQILSDYLPDVDIDLLLSISVSASLVQIGENIRFTHQLLQEYFAGLIIWSEIKNQTDPHRYWEDAAWLEPNGHEEALIVLAGVRGDPEYVAQWVAPANPLLAYQILTDSGLEFDLSQISSATRQTIVESAKSKAEVDNPIHRATAYQVLGYFDADDRDGIGLNNMGMPKFKWCEIPPGEFLYGESNRSIKINYRYGISKYPVTNKQFEAFVASTDGYHNPEWWSQTGLLWKNSRDNPTKYKEYDYVSYLPNYPRIYITFHEASAFCKWLTKKLGYPVLLPNVYEWEKAARGTDGRAFAWGNEWQPEKCNNNVGKNELQHISAVGSFLQGDSPYGVSDMTGNVWEWCFPEVPEDINEAPLKFNQTGQQPVLCGGSWHNANIHFFYAYFRGRQDRNWRSDGWGFRIIRLYDN